MEVKVNDIISYMEELAPVSMAEEWDNSGFLIGNRDGFTDAIVLSLDFNEASIEKAIEVGAKLIITHHPVFLQPLKSINTDDALGRRIIRAIENGISVYSAHTNLDYAKGGTNDELFRILELTNKIGFVPSAKNPDIAMGRIGNLPYEMSLEDFSAYIGQKLGTNLIRYTGDGSKIIRKIALCTGAGAGNVFFYTAIEKGCDAYLTSDIKYHQALDALDMGLPLIDATHYATEVIVSKSLKKYLEGMFLKDNIDLKIYELEENLQPFKISRQGG